LEIELKKPSKKLRTPLTRKSKNKEEKNNQSKIYFEGDELIRKLLIHPLKKHIMKLTSLNAGEDKNKEQKKHS